MTKIKHKAKIEANNNNTRKAKKKNQEKLKSPNNNKRKFLENKEIKDFYFGTIGNYEDILYLKIHSK